MPPTVEKPRGDRGYERIDFSIPSALVFQHPAMTSHCVKRPPSGQPSAKAETVLAHYCLTSLGELQQTRNVQQRDLAIRLLRDVRSR
jgi:hypothetical protein